MIDIELVESSIQELENGGMSYEQCRNLSALYIVRDTYYRSRRTDTSSGSSEFLRVVKGLPVPGVLDVMDEVMQAVRILNPATYRAAIEKLKQIGDS